MKSKRLFNVTRFPKTFRKNALVSLLLMVFLMPSNAEAQGKFIFGAECNSGNLWSEAFLGFPTKLINALILDAQGYDLNNSRVPGFALTYRFNRIKVNDKKIDYDGNRFFGFKGVDLFRDFEYSLKFGYQPIQIPVGFYARVGYRHENFETRLSDADDWVKHRINCLRPGLGVRISPLENLLDDEQTVCPIIELGGYYDYYVNYKGAYGNDKQQLNNGVSLYAGVGIKLESGTAVMLTFDHENYDLFNKDFVVNGVKPYADTKTTHFNISLSCTIGL